MSAGRPAARVLVALSLLLAGCGGDPEPDAGRWLEGRVEGVANASDLAVDGDVLLLVAGGDDRRLHVVARADLRAGRVARATALPLDVRAEARLVGTDAFAGVGYTAGDLWALPVDFQAVATQPPNLLYVADRAHRVVYSGKIDRSAAGRPVGARFDRVFVVPGGDRPGRTRSDWRDAGSGIAGLVAIPARSRAEDLFVAERQGAVENEVRVWRMDRFGQAGSWFGVAFPEGTAADVGGLTADGQRLLLVRGGESATLARVEPGAWMRTVAAGAGEEAPRPPPGSAWRGVARASDGTLYLVSSGPECRIAWRSE